MNAFSSGFGPRSGQSSLDRANLGASATSLRWAALSEAGKVVATLAGMEIEHPSKQVRNFPVLVRECPKWQRDLAENGVIDLAAIMEPGISALLAINARGADPRPAARALWHEFVTARAAILQMLPANGDMGPRRSA